MFGRRTYLPVLQIVHITDLHVVTRETRSLASQLRVALRFMPLAVREFIESRSAPHDETALQRLSEFLPSLLSVGGDWEAVPTWLLDTGDLTGYGDKPSLEHGHGWLRRFGFASILADDRSRSLYGNHDAWPTGLPILAADTAIQRQLQTLRDAYPHSLPTEPLRAPIPGSKDNAEIVLWSLNSVDPSRMANTFALGLLRHDRAQETGIEHMGGETIASGRRSFRILATHHPIHYPPPEPELSMVMVNAAHVGEQVSTMVPNGPAAHLVLSGHTHQLYPPGDELPGKSADCRHAPLPKATCQLIGPTLSQQDFSGDRWPHRLELLRFYFAAEKQDELLMERIVAGREWGVGPFEVIEFPESGTGEEIRFRF